MSVLLHNLQNAQSAANAALKQESQISIIAIPDEIKREKTKAAIIDAMTEIKFGSREVLQFLEMKTAAHYAYDLGRPNQLGLEHCDWEKGVYEGIIIDYNAAYLSFYLTDIKETRAFRRAHAAFFELGEDVVRSDKATVSSPLSNPAQGL